MTKIDETLDKLWKDAWGKLGAYNFDGTGEDTLTKAQAKDAIYTAIMEVMPEKTTIAKDDIGVDLARKSAANNAIDTITTSLNELFGRE